MSKVIEVVKYSPDQERDENGKFAGGGGSGGGGKGGGSKAEKPARFGRRRETNDERLARLVAQDKAKEKERRAAAKPAKDAPKARGMEWRKKHPGGTFSTLENEQLREKSKLIDKHDREYSAAEKKVRRKEMTQAELGKLERRMDGEYKAMESKHEQQKKDYKASAPPKKRRTAEQRRRDNFVLYD